MDQISLSLCDTEYRFLQSPEDTVSVLKERKASGVSSVRTGSYFCPNFFLYIMEKYKDTIMKAAEAADMGVIPVVPVTGQKQLRQIRDVIAGFAEDAAAVVVNDYGMLLWAAENLTCPVIMGRLFFRQPRDPRSEELAEEIAGIPFPASSLEKYRDHYRVRGIEMEGFGEAVDLSSLPAGIRFGMHRPWILMSCGRICEDASLFLPVEKKFRPDIPCSVECVNVYRDYLLTNAGVRKYGKAVFFYQEQEPELIGADGRDVERIEILSDL